MKTVSKNILGLLFLSLFFVACNGDMEKRVSNLERRMVELENKSQAQNLNAHQDHSGVVQTAGNQSTEPEAKPEGPMPEFSFDKELHDFGQITEGEIATHTFKFTNTGDAPLVIQNATATCGCTVPSYPKQPIAVGESGEIVVKFDSSNKPGVQNKTVTITANTYPTTSKLNIKSVVVAKNAGALGSGK